jgi:hypothetical protein
MSTYEQRLLGRYVENVSGLLSVLRMTQSVVFGDAVLHCLQSMQGSFDAGAVEMPGLEILMTYASTPEYQSSAIIAQNYFKSQGYSVLHLDETHVCVVLLMVDDY